jgi:hypothetical protein
MSESLTVSHDMGADLILQLVVSASGPVRVSWGDGSAVETVAAVSSTPHTYSKAGGYKVQVVGPSGLSQAFSVVAGKPLKMWNAQAVRDNRAAPRQDAAAMAGRMPAWRAKRVRDKRAAPLADAAAVGATTSRIG